jgi:hypothetical protein
MEEIISEAVVRLFRLADRMSRGEYETARSRREAVADEALWMQDQLDVHRRCKAQEGKARPFKDAAHAACDPDEFEYPVPLYDIGGEG